MCEKCLQFCGAWSEVESKGFQFKVINDVSRMKRKPETKTYIFSKNDNGGA